MKKHFLISISAVLLTASFVYAEEASTSSDTRHKEDQSTSSVQLFTECSQNAIEERDTALSASRSAYNAVMTQALTERKNREKLAIAVSGESAKKNAVKTSVETYKNQAKAAQNNLVATRKEAWQTFEEAIKQCHTLHEDTANKEVSEKQEKDATLDIYLKKNEDRKGVKEYFLESIKSLFN